ncbi:arginine--tRNA ligase [archaeon]|nr:arginine--tRNA ligase [archaeon]|tara:strand:+ start:72 stop:1775 length:1704 start_codon:yes stop_codon:yes gene_type:complete
MDNPWKQFTDEIRNLAKSNNLELPPKNIKADIALPCFGKGDPVENAKTKSQEIEKIISNSDYSGLIKSVQPMGPYVNFELNYEKFNKLVIEQIQAQKDEYGNGNEQGKILLEHTSINPTGPVHVGRLRNSLIGDSIRRILKASGYDIETHFYINDMGKQVALILWGMKNNLQTDKELEMNYEKYKTKSDFKTMFTYVAANKEMESNENVENEVAKLLQDSEKGGETGKELREISENCVKGQKDILKKLGIIFDKFDYESTFVENKDTEKVMKQLSIELVKKDGMIGLDLSKHGLKREKGIMVLKRKDGTSVYTLRDIAYHLYKLKEHDRIVTVVGEDHKVEMKELKFILENYFSSEFKSKTMDVIHYAFVSFKDMQLSTRKGQTAPLDAMLDQGIEKAKQEIEKRDTYTKNIDERAKKIAVAAIRYTILKQEKNKQMTFIWDDALKFEGDTGPYLQYAYARAKSILAKSKKKPSLENLENLTDELENKLIKQLALFPSTLKKSAEQEQINVIASYLNELASTFNEYYHNTKVIGTKEEEQRLALVQVVAQTLKNAMNLLGIETMEKM